MLPAQAGFKFPEGSSWPLPPILRVCLFAPSQNDFQVLQCTPPLLYGDLLDLANGFLGGEHLILR